MLVRSLSLLLGIAACATSAPANKLPPAAAPSSSEAKPQEPRPAAPAQPSPAPATAEPRPDIQPTPRDDVYDTPRAEPRVGRPFFTALAADLHGHVQFPAGAHGSAIGCIHLAPDGTIVQTRIQGEAEPAARQALERALADLQAARQRKPIPVPADVARETSQKWLCFRIDFDHVD